MKFLQLAWYIFERNRQRRRKKLVSGGAGVDTAENILVLLAGQSNMVGTDTIVPLYTYDSLNDPTDARILQWSFDGQGTPAKANTLLLAQDPLLHPGTATTNRAVGPGMPFARALLPTLGANQKIVLVPVAVGGTGLVGDVWASPSGTQYVNARNALINALNTIPQSRLDYILWWQGENDMFYDRSAAAYQTAADAVFAGFRGAHAKAANASIIMGGIVQEYFYNAPTKRPIQYALANTPLRINKAYFIPPPVGSYTSGDTWHASSVAQRLIGSYWAAAKALPAAFTTSAPATPTGVQLEGEVISWIENGAPAYVVQSRAAGSADAWTDTIVYPEKYGVALRHHYVVPGAGDREARVLARSKAGDSAPSSALTYTIPVTAEPAWLWDHDYHNSANSGGNFTAIKSIGTDTVDWTIVGTIPRVLVNGIGAANVNNTLNAMYRAVRIPAGSYTILAALEYPLSGNNVLGGVGDATHGFEIGLKGPTQAALGVFGIQHNNAGTVLTDAYDCRTLGYVCVAFVYDSTAGTVKVYINGALYKTGSIAARGSTSVATKAWNWLADNRADATIGVKLAWKCIGGALTQAQIIKATHTVKALYGIEWMT